MSGRTCVSCLWLVVALVISASSASAVDCTTSGAGGRCESLSLDHWCRVSLESCSYAVHGMHT